MIDENAFITDKHIVLHPENKRAYFDREDNIVKLSETRCKTYYENIVLIDSLKCLSMVSGRKQCLVLSRVYRIQMKYHFRN